MKREFTVDTPLGKLHVWAKRGDASDIADDYPGVYIDLVTDYGTSLLACVEYDSCFGNMLTTAYDFAKETPRLSYTHDIDEEFTG